MRQLVAVLAPLEPAASSGVPVMASIPPQETENLVIFLSKVSYEGGAGHTMTRGCALAALASEVGEAAPRTRYCCYTSHTPPDGTASWQQA